MGSKLFGAVLAFSAVLFLLYAALEGPWSFHPQGTGLFDESANVSALLAFRRLSLVVLQNKDTTRSNTTQPLSDPFETEAVDMHNNTGYVSSAGAEHDDVTVPDVSAEGVNVTSSHKQVTQVIIHARLRSGSTFASEFFNRHSDVFYVYEPLRFNSKTGRHVYVSKETANDVIQNIFSCNFDPIYNYKGNRSLVSWLRTRCFCALTKQMPGCTKQYARLAQSKVEQNCRDSKLHVIKSIRIGHISDIWELISQRVKVVQLLRDPRGTMASRRMTSKEIRSSTGLKLEAQDFCDRAVQDIRFIQARYKDFPDLIQKNYLAVRYEDMARNATLQMNKIYEFLGVAPDDSLRQWVSSIDQKSISGQNSKKRSSYYGTERENPQLTSISWRKKLALVHTKTVEEVCKDYMHIFGYLPASSQDLLRNISIPLLDSFNFDAVIETS